MKEEIPVKENILKVIVKPNSPKNEITAIDKERNALRVNIKAPAEKGKANKELVKFFSKILKRKIEIVSGLKSREKLIKIY